MLVFILDSLLLYIRDFIAAIGVAVIVFGAIRSVFQLGMFLMHKNFEPNYIRLQFGDCVILGLEFMVGADIVGSLVQPDYYSLGLLAILVAIRTVLSYYLNLELRSLSPQQRQQIK